jgi:4-hydroxybenzoate polyprenyltransferase
MVVMVRIWGKESYDKAMIMPLKLRGFIDLIRPFTLLAPMIGGLCGGLMGWASVNDYPSNPLPFLFINDHFPFIQYHDGFLQLIIGVSTLIILNAASNALNGVYDVEIDKINKPYRPIPAGVVTKDEARTIAWILYPLVLFRAMLMDREPGTSGFFGLFVLLIMLITIAYSTRPLRLKKRLWISNITIAFARGLLGFVAAWSIFGNPFSDLTPWFIGGVMMIFLIGAITSKDFTDIIGDKVHGIRTLPVVYGIKKSALVSGPFFVIPFFLILIGLMTGVLKSDMFWVLLLAIWGVVIAILMQKVATREEKIFENTIIWVNMYLFLMAMQISFFITYVFEFEILG